MYGHPVPLVHVVAGGDEGVLAAQHFGVQGLGFEDGLRAASCRGEKEEDQAVHLEHVPIRTERVRLPSFSGHPICTDLVSVREDVHCESTAQEVHAGVPA